MRGRQQERRRHCLAIGIAVVGEHIAGQHDVLRGGEAVGRHRRGAIGRRTGDAQPVGSDAARGVAHRLKVVDPRGSGREIDSRIQ